MELTLRAFSDSIVLDGAVLRLNPYYCGTYLTRIEKALKLCNFMNVLILIIVELTLRGKRNFNTKRNQRCLNPYYCGTYLTSTSKNY